MKVLENTPEVLSLGKLCDENGYSDEWINGQKPHLIKKGIRIQCNMENFVPIVVPGSSARSSSGSHHSTSRTPSTQERHCSTSSSSSSSVLVSSLNVDDRTGQPVVGRESNHERVHQAHQNFPNTNMKERNNPLSADSGRASSEIPAWLQEFREILVDDVKTTPQKTHFRDVKFARTWDTDWVTYERTIGLQHPEEKNLALGIAYAWWNAVDKWNLPAGRWGARNQWQRENQDPENQHEAQHEHLNVRVVVKSLRSIVLSHSFLAHIAWLKIFECVSHSIPWSSPCMHEVSVLSDFHDLFIIFNFLLSFLIILKQFLLPFNFTEVR